MHRQLAWPAGGGDCDGVGGGGCDGVGGGGCDDVGDGGTAVENFERERERETEKTSVENDNFLREGWGFYLI